MPSFQELCERTVTVLQGARTPKSIARKLGVPRKTVKCALRSLVRVGDVVMHLRSPQCTRRRRPVYLAL